MQTSVSMIRNSQDDAIIKHLCSWLHQLSCDGRWTVTVYLKQNIYWLVNWAGRDLAVSFDRLYLYSRALRLYPSPWWTPGSSHTINSGSRFCARPVGSEPVTDWKITTVKSALHSADLWQRHIAGVLRMEVSQNLLILVVKWFNINIFHIITQYIVAKTLSQLLTFVIAAVLPFQHPWLSLLHKRLWSSEDSDPCSQISVQTCLGWSLQMLDVL